MSRIRRGGGILAVLLVLVAGGALYLSTRGGGDDRTRGGAEAATPAAAASGRTVAQLQAGYLGALPGAAAIASGSGRLPVTGATAGEVPATLDVMSLESSDVSTVLRWRIRTEQRVTAVADPWVSRSGRDASTLVIVSKQTDQRLTIGTFEMEGAGACTCAALPMTFGPEGAEISSSVFAPLDAKATEVVVQATGFDPVTVPVTRR